MKDIIKKKIEIANKRIQELTKSGDLKKLSEKEKYQISKFYESKSKKRLKTAKIIYDLSRDPNTSYNDYAEVVAAAYYSMYYIVHAFLALKYKTKLREDLRGVHAITQHIILYYLVKTKKIARHLLENYLTTFKTTAEIQRISIDDFQEKAYEYARKYVKSRSAREIFNYNITPNIEEYHAKQAINRAEEFINTIREIMILK